MLLFMIFLFILSIQISQSFHIKRFIILALFNLTRAPILFQLVDVGYIKSDTERLWARTEQWTVSVFCIEVSKECSTPLTGAGLYSAGWRGLGRGS